MGRSPEKLHGTITLDGEEIGTFEVDANEVTAKMHGTTNDLDDAQEFAYENGMTVALVLYPDFNDYVPAHRKDAVSPKK